MPRTTTPPVDFVPIRLAASLAGLTVEQVRELITDGEARVVRRTRWIRVALEDVLSAADR